MKKDKTKPKKKRFTTLRMTNKQKKRLRNSLANVKVEDCE